MFDFVQGISETGGGCTGYTGDTSVYQFDSQPEPPEASDYPARGAHASARGLTILQSCGKLLDERGIARDKPPHYAEGGRFSVARGPVPRDRWSGEGQALALR